MISLGHQRDTFGDRLENKILKYLCVLRTSGRKQSFFSESETPNAFFSITVNPLINNQLELYKSQ
jgi:hypothetical protein